MDRPAVPRRRAEPFRPQFTLMVLYLGLFFVLFCVVLALPALIEAAGQVPAGGELTEKEIARSEQIWREALRGRIPVALGCAVAAMVLAVWKKLLPGLRSG